MTDLIIVRHGETIENKLGICQGQTEGILSENGIRQNKLQAKRLKNYKMDVIYTSPLKRAIETGKEIWEYHKNINLRTDSRLIERNMGILQGHRFPKNYDVTKTIEGMESMWDVRNRLQLFIDDLKISHSNQTILLVSHGITIKILTTLL
ncbi:MAG: histidine phosphatase family protein, partial [Bacteroidetes bacterium]|nr:histidine phosphatase family protein [Bacteroidota bacterium]